MSTSFLSLIFVGVVGVGTFSGTLQQNFSHPKIPEIDLLFKEIEKLIRDFSRNNPMTETQAIQIKTPSSGSGSISRKRRDTKNHEISESKHTLSIWTDLWVVLISNYVRFLWQKCGQKFTEKISEDKKQEAVAIAENNVKNEREEFKKKLDEKKEEIENIYEKMKTFVLKIDFPKEYEYDNGGDLDCPYENYVKKIV